MEYKTLIKKTRKNIFHYTFYVVIRFFLLLISDQIKWVNERGGSNIT